MFSAPSHPRPKLTLLAVCLGPFMLIIDVQIVVVALPSIRTAQEFRPPDSRRIDLPGGAVFALGLVASSTA